MSMFSLLDHTHKYHQKLMNNTSQTILKLLSDNNRETTNNNINLSKTLNEIIEVLRSEIFLTDPFSNINLINSNNTKGALTNTYKRYYIILFTEWTKCE